MVFADATLALCSQVLDEARIRRLHLATAESCTGGLIAGALTAIPGSSDVIERGFVVYSNQSKTDLLRIPTDMIDAHGAVSAEVARAMAEGALTNSAADIAVSCTGIAGPGGGSAEKPVGLVHLAVALRRGETRHRECRFGALSRDEIRIRTVDAALQMLLDAICALP